MCKHLVILQSKINMILLGKYSEIVHIVKLFDYVCI